MLQEITTTGITTTTTRIVKENLVRKIPQKMEPLSKKLSQAKFTSPS